MALINKKNRSRIFGIFAIVFLLLFSAFLYYKSNFFKTQGDTFLAYGNAQEAIVLYKKALQLFPLRWDIIDDIVGANLVLRSHAEYARISSFAELQSIPPLSNLPTTTLAPNELFVPAFLYHHIEANPLPNDPIYAALYVSPNQLDQQLFYLATHNYHTVTYDDVLNALNGKEVLPANPIILTFDDGYRSFYDNAFPILKKYHMKAIQFVITQVVGNTAYLTWDQIKEMDRSGLIEIGAHTRHHPNLPDLQQAAIVDEIKGSKQDLEQHLGHPVYWFAYPYGSYSPFIMQTVKDAGFKGAASTVYGVGQSKDNLFLSTRIMIDGRFSLENIARRIKE